MTHEDVAFMSQWGQTDWWQWWVSEVGHVGQDVGETDDELSETEDNEISEADMMSDESHETDEWWWAGWDLRFVRLKTRRGLQITIVILNIIWFVGIFSNWINYWLKCLHNIFHLYTNKRVQIKLYL